MNCNDISRILDEREIAALCAADLAEFKAHLSACSDCSGQSLASQRVLAFRSAVPPLPASLHERAEQLYEQRMLTAGERRTRRPVLIGSLFLLGAAASLFGTVPWSDTSPAEQ
jgi:hypothetical protein